MSHTEKRRDALSRLGALGLVASASSLVPLLPVRAETELTAPWRSERVEAGEVTRGRFNVGSGEVGVVAASYDLHRVTLRIVDAPPHVAVGSVLSELFRTSPFLAGINGGYFTAAGLPDGLLIRGGVTVSPARADFSGAVGSLENGLPFVVRTKDIARMGNVRDAQQSDPFIIDPGGIVGIHSDRGVRARRSVVLLGAGKIAFVATSACGLLELADAMIRTPRTFGVASIERALNLDGGPSTTLCVRLPHGEQVLIPETGPLRTLAILTARSRS